MEGRYLGRKGGRQVPWASYIDEKGRISALN